MSSGVQSLRRPIGRTEKGPPPPSAYSDLATEVMVEVLSEVGKNPRKDRFVKPSMDADAWIVPVRFIETREGRVNFVQGDIGQGSFEIVGTGKDNGPIIGSPHQQNLRPPNAVVMVPVTHELRDERGGGRGGFVAQRVVGIDCSAHGVVVVVILEAVHELGQVRQFGCVLERRESCIVVPTRVVVVVVVVLESDPSGQCERKRH